MGHPVPTVYKYEVLVIQVGVVSNLRQSNIIMIPERLGPENDCTGEAQQ
jgi:hypothetical protein